MKYPKEDRGRCRSCGFLARRIENPEPPLHYEVSKEVRETGNYPYPHRQGQPQQLQITCYRGAYDLPDLIAKELGARSARPGGASLEESILAVISDDRRCNLWWPYVEDVGPKEHLQEYRINSIERAQLRLSLAALLLAIAAIVVPLVVAFVRPTGDTVNNYYGVTPTDRAPHIAP